LQEEDAVDNALITAPGEMISVGGSRFHVRRHEGPRERTFILEAGLTMMSACWGWLAPELAKLGTVVSYDRAGLGWSDEREGLRDAKQIGGELAALVHGIAPSGKLILVGHSMGAFHNCALLRQQPELASALIWLDPAHPQQLTRSRRMQTFFFFLEFAHQLAARGLPTITLRMVPHLQGLPPRDFQAVQHFLKNSRHLKTTVREARAWNLAADYIREMKLRATKLLVISAQKNALRQWGEYQKELAGLSTQSRHVTFTDMSHLSMLAQKQHALRVAKEVETFVTTL
jgi:pimeloyl-ACP methyl ester carboxylesterase